MSDMTPESLAYVSLVFKMFDTDGDGLITRKDTRNILKKMGYKGTSEQVRYMMTSFDSNGSGTLDWDDFLLMMQKTRKDLLSEEELKDVFNKLDTDGNGSIDEAELRNFLSVVGRSEVINEEERENAILQLDTNRDGKIHFQEFLSLIGL